MWFVRTSLGRPVMAVMAIVSLVMLGWVSLGRLGVDLFPKVEFPFVVVQTRLEGASPEVTETEVTDPIEEQVNSLSGIETLTSISQEDFSMIRVEFELEEDPDTKAQEVRDKVDLALPNLPGDADLPTVQKMDPDADSVITIMVSGDLTVGELTRFADEVLKEQLQRVAGVGGVQLVGGRKREIRVWVDADRLRSYGVTVLDVMRSIRSQHTELPGGRLETNAGRQELTVKTRGRFESVEGFREVVVAQQERGPIYLKDVATIEDGLEDERTYAELNGEPGVALEVRRQSGKNTVEVVNRVKQELVRLQKEAPPGIHITTAKDIARFIETSIRDVYVDISIAIGLVVLVTLVFLMNIRTTLIVATAIPTSLISTFFAFYVLDFTVNMLTMMALSVAIGLLVDDAIVVLESIFRRVEEGMSPGEAAEQGAYKVVGAVVAGSLSIIAVFVPIAFMEGIVGRFFFQYGLTIVFAVSMSLFVSLTLVPVLCAWLLTPQKHHGVFSRLEFAYQSLESGYASALGKSLNHRWVVVLIAGITIYIGVLVAGNVPLAFSPKTDRSEFLATIELPLGTGLAQAKVVGHRVAGQIEDLDHVEKVFMSIGGGTSQSSNVVNFYVGTVHKSERDEDYQVVMDHVRTLLNEEVTEARNINLAEISWVGGGSSGFNSDIYVVLRGSDLAALDDISRDVMARMADGPFRDIRSSYELGKPELGIVPNRERIADLNVSIHDLASVIQAAVGGIDVASYQDGSSRYDVRVRLRQEDRNEPGELEQIQVRAGDGTLVDLASIVDIERVSGPLRIDRIDRSRQVSIFANAPPNVPVGIPKEAMDDILATTPMPENYSFRYAGQSEQIEKSAQAIMFAFIMAIVALYVVLASQFNSFGQPLVVMTTAPLSFVGAFSLLFLLDAELSLFAQIGIVALMGLVMKNGILIIDFANQNMANGMGHREAIEDAGKQRLRPVLMTAFSTIFGMIPVAFSNSDGAEFRTALGVIIIGGMSSSTLLTLFVVPTAFSYYWTVIDRAGDLRDYVARRLGYDT